MFKFLLIAFIVFINTISVTAGPTDFPVIIGTQGFEVPNKGYIYIGMSKEYACTVLGDAATNDGMYTSYNIYDSSDLSLHYNNNNIVIGIYCTIPGTNYGGYIITPNTQTIQTVNKAPAITLDMFTKGTYLVIDPSTGRSYLHTPYVDNLTPLYETNYSKTNAIKLGI